MSKRVFVVSTSPRKGGNSNALAEEFVRGAKAAGHEAETICLHDKSIGFCKGCLACQSKQDGHCVMRDDADAIVQRIATADVVAFATPIYFYEMCAQMKALLDRTNPLFPIDYAFRDIYLLAAAAEPDDSAMEGALNGLEGWISCFEQARLAGSVFAGNATSVGSIAGNPALKKAYELGKNV